MPSPAHKTTVGPSGGPAIVESAPFCEVPLGSVLHRLPDHENCRRCLLTCASQATVRLNQRFDHQPYSAQRDRAARPRRRTNCCTSSPGIGLNCRRMPVIFLCSVSTSAAIEACGGQREHLKSKMGTTARNSNFKRKATGSFLAPAVPVFAQNAPHICRRVFTQS